jgi:hypothetical protein
MFTQLTARVQNRPRIANLAIHPYLHRFITRPAYPHDQASGSIRKLCGYNLYVFASLAAPTAPAHLGSTLSTKRSESSGSTFVIVSRILLNSEAGASSVKTMPLKFEKCTGYLEDTESSCPTRYLVRLPRMLSSFWLYQIVSL